MAKLVLSGVLAGVVALGSVSLSFAAQADVYIASVDCNGEPEEVVVENAGDAAQELAGWQLQSDPIGEEVFDLASLGSLQPGATVFIRSGPSATGVFTWSEEFIFRDGDPTDYVQLVDPGGTVVDEVTCGGEAVAPSPTPTVSPTASPTASPEPSPAADNVPNGGGPPPEGGGIASAATVGIGALMTAAGTVAVALSRVGLRLRGETGIEVGARAIGGSRPRGGARSTERLRSQTWGPLLLGLATVALLLFLIRRS